MHPVVIHQKYSSEERVNDNELDLLLEVSINENASASSRRSSNESRVSSNMDRDDLWEVTILPSLSSQATSSSDTLGTSVRVLNAVTETKRGLHFSIDERKGKNEGTTHESAVRPKIVASPTYEKLNHDHSRRSFTRDKRSASASRRDEKELNDQVDEKLNNKRSGVCRDNEWRASPFIELGALYKVLDFITDSDPRVSSLTNNCCNEISRTLRYLIALSSDKKLDDLLSNDSSLYRCERCGVISHMLKSYSAIEEIQRSRTRVVQDADIATVKHDCINHHRNKEKSHISTSHSNLSHNTQSRMLVDNYEVDRRAKREGELSEKSLPAKERSFVMRRRTENPNGVNDISAAETDLANAKIENTLLNNSAIKRLFADYEAARRNTGYESNCATRNDRFCHVEPSTTSKVRANIDKEMVVRKISYENKSRFAMEDLRGARKTQGRRRLFAEDNDVLSVGDTVKYLAGGQLSALDKGENELLSKLQDRRRVHLKELRKGQSSVLYGSRDDYYPRCDPGFWLFDKSGHLPEVASNEYRFLPMSRLDDSSDGFRVRNIGGSPRKTGSWTECVEKDSLENCALLERRQDSDTVTFSSSSAENLMYEWMGALGEKDDTNDTDSDVPRGRPLVSSRASLDIARHVRAEIAEARRSSGAGESIGEARTCDSDARLPPETRSKMCHSIGKMISSDPKDSVFCHEEDLATYIDASNSEKLAPPESSNVTFVHSDKSFKVNNEITSTWLDDCIPSKLSELREDQSFLVEKRANVVEVCSQSVDRSKDHIQTSHEYSTAVVSADKLGKTREKLASDSCRRVARRIVYKNLSGNVDNDDILTEISPVYREILRNSEDMDWDVFRELIERLHPGQKELWRDICKTVDEEAARLSGDANGSMEVCIEISPVILEQYLKTDKPMACAREIAFELDMTMKDVESFLDKREPHLAEERLDTHKATDEGVTDWDDGGRKLIPEQIR